MWDCYYLNSPFLRPPDLVDSSVNPLGTYKNSIYNANYGNNNYKSLLVITLNIILSTWRFYRFRLIRKHFRRYFSAFCGKVRFIRHINGSPLAATVAMDERSLTIIHSCKKFHQILDNRLFQELSVLIISN